MPYVKSNGTKIWYDVIGSGEPLVLIGGGSLVHNQWDFMLPILKDHFKVILYDQRGAGLSDRAPFGITVEQWVDDLKMILDEIGVGKTHLFGTSNGSFIVIRFAAKHPERTGTIIHYGMHKMGEQATKMARIGFKIIEEFGTGRMGSYFLARLNGIAPEYEDWVVRRFEENNSADSWRPMREALQIDLTEDLLKVRAPQMILLGDTGPLGKDTDHAAGWKDVKKLCPDTEVAVVPNASGTVCVLEKPGEVARHVINFLTRHKIEKES